jgi:hypothetical protein
MIDTVGSHVLPETYRAYGNDGHHWGRAVNALPNYVVPDSVANALVTASDHLPVVADFVLNAETNAAEHRSVAADLDVMKCYPNPFNPVVTTEIAGLHEDATLRVTDLLGPNIFARRFRAGGEATPLQMDFSSRSRGAYFVTLRASHACQTRRITLVR